MCVEWDQLKFYVLTLILVCETMYKVIFTTLRWRHDDGDSVSNHQPHDCLPKCLFERTSKKASKLRVTGLCAGNSPWTDEFPAQMASNAENVSIWWRHHDILHIVTYEGWAIIMNLLDKLKSCSPGKPYNGNDRDRYWFIITATRLITIRN